MAFFLDHELLLPLLLSLKLAALSSCILMLLATPLAFWLARAPSLLKTVIEALVSLPLVLPPTVLGFYLLLLFNPEGTLGRFWFWLTHSNLIFSFPGLLISSLVYSLPFVVRPLITAFSSLDEALLEAAANLKASPLDRFFSLVLPLSKSGYLSAGVLSFAHTLGEFGVVLMLGGSIPGKTLTVSIAIVNWVEQMDYQKAYILSALLLGLAFILLFIFLSAQQQFFKFK